MADTNVKSYLYNWCNDLNKGVNNKINCTLFDPNIEECNFEGPEISSFKDERMEYNKLKKLENILLDETPKAKLDILKNINNNKNKENILLFIMLIIGLCYAIFFIYNYFIF